MSSLVYILKIFYYFIYIFIVYYISKKFYKSNNKFPLNMIVIICILFGFYAIICGQYPYASDRLNFAFRFESDIYGEFVKNESYGLYLLESFLHIFTHNAKVLFFFTAYCYMFITLIAYKKCKMMTPEALLFLLASTYPIYGCYMLKQAMAMAFVSLGFSYYFEEEKIKCSLCFVIAIMFHQASIIIIPIVVLVELLYKKLISRKLIYISLIIIVLMFSQLNTHLFSLAIKLVPSLDYKLQKYLNSNNGSIANGNNIMTIFKGIPFYATLFFGYLNRKKFIEDKKKYDVFMFLVTFVAISVLLSKYMYWMFRFGLFLYFPVSIFVYEILKNMKSKKDANLYFILTYGMSFYLSLRLWVQYYFLYGGL